MSQNPDYYKNIRFYYFANFCHWLTFFGAIYALFYQNLGLSFTQILIAFSARDLAMILFEVPSGVFADFFGRKKTLQFGTLILIVGFLLIFLAKSFVMVFLANIIVGISNAFASGADMALLYDSLKASGKDDLFRKVRAQFEAMGKYGLALGSLLTGLTSSLFGIAYAPLFNILSYCLAMYFLTKIQEPPLETKTQEIKYFQHTWESLQIILRKKDLFYLSLFSGVFLVAINASYVFQQSYFQIVGFPVSLIGIITAGFVLIAGLSASNAKHLLKKISNPIWEFVFTWSLQAIMFLLLSLIIHPLLGVLFMALGQTTHGLNPVLVSHYSNDRISSQKRATTLSIQGFLKNVLMIILLPLFGLLADKYGIKTGFLAISLFLILIGGGLLLLLNKEIKMAKQL